MEGPRRLIALFITAAVAGACAPDSGPASAAPPLPEGLEIVWDIRDSTETGGRGPYFTHPAAPRLRAGPVFVAWSCSGHGTLSVVPAVVDYDGAPPPGTSPLAFQLICPTPAGGDLLDWRELPALAIGGENVAQVRPAMGVSEAIDYRVVFAQEPQPTTTESSGSIGTEAAQK